MSQIAISSLIKMAELARAASDFSTLELTERGIELRQSRKVPGRPTAHRAFVFSWPEIDAQADPVHWMELELERGSAMITRLIKSEAETIG